MLEKCVLFLESCAVGIKEHLVKFKNYEFSFSFIQKTMRQIFDIRFRCALISIMMASLCNDPLKPGQKVDYLTMALSFYKNSKKKSTSQKVSESSLEKSENWF